MAVTKRDLQTIEVVLGEALVALSKAYASDGVHAGTDLHNDIERSLSQVGRAAGIIHKVILREYKTLYR